MRPVVSTPIAWSLPDAEGEIRTYFHAGGMTRDLMRESAVSSDILIPFAST